MHVNPKGEVLRISAQLLEELVGLAQEAAPDEACGLLFGPSRGEAQVTEVAQLANLRAGLAQAAFQLDPGEWVAAERAREGRGLANIGFWHSHPSGAVVPSARDAEAAAEGSLHLIVSPQGEAAAWVLVAGRFRARRVQPLPRGQS